MGLWDEVVGIATRAGAKKKTQQSSKQGALSASPAMLKKSAKQPGLWDNVVSEASSFFKPAGVLYKNVQDLAHGGETDSYQKSLAASREKPTWQKMAGLAIHSWAPGAAPYLGYDPADNVIGNAIRALPDKAVPTAAAAVNKFHVPDALQWNPLGRVQEALLHPIDTYRKVDAFARGVNPGDGDMQANMGSRGQEIWGNLQADVARVEDMNRQKPYVQRGVEAATSGLASVLPKGAGDRVKSVAQYFDPNSEDVSTAYEKAGYDPMTAMAGAMSNPLEWLGAESGGELATKLKDAGKLRKVVNAAGKLMDPTQLAIDATGKGLNKAASIDWKLPGGSKNAPLSTEEIARRAGVDPAELKAYSEALDAPLATSAKEAAHSSQPSDLWSEIMRDDAGDATRARIAGLIDETDPDYLNRIARSVPDANARTLEPTPAPIQELPTPKFEGDYVPNDYDPRFTSDFGPIPREVPAPARDDAFLLDQAQQAADIHEAGLDFQRQHKIYANAKEAQLGRKLNELTPSILPQFSVEDALRWLDEPVSRADGSLEEALRAQDPGAAMPRYTHPPASLEALGEPSREAIDAALNTPKTWGDLLLNEGDMGARARQVAPTLPVPRTEIDSLLAAYTPSALPSNVTEDALRWLDGGGNVEAPQALPRGAGRVAPEQARPGLVEPLPEAVTGARSPAMELVDNVAAPGMGQKPQRTLAGGLKLYSNPLDPTPVWEMAKAVNKTVGDFMARLEGKVNTAVGTYVDSKNALRQVKNGISRAFSETYGVASKELSRVLDRAQMAENAINRTTAETVAVQLKAGPRAIRELLQDYMNKTLPRAEAMKTLGKEMVESADSVRYLMDDAGVGYFSSLLEIEPRFLREASQQEKMLMAQVYETFDGRQTTVGRDSLTRKKVVERARQVNEATGLPYFSEDVIKRSLNLIDGAMERLSSKGYVKDGRLVDMALSMPTWVSNLGKYEPRLYKLIEYGIDVSSPTAMRDFVNAIEARRADTTNMLNELNRAQGKPEIQHRPIPDDLRNFLLAQRTGKGSWSQAVAEEAGRFMKRKDLSQEMRDILGPMVNPAYTYTKGVQHVHRAENIAKVRRWAADHEFMVSRAGESEVEFMKRTGVKPEEIAWDFSQNPQYASQVGALQGRYMHRDVADMLAVTGMIPHTSPQGDLNAWKAWTRSWLAVNKVILNPASHFRQALQNTFSLYTNLGAKAAIDMWGSIKDVKNKSKVYLEARNAGVLSAGHDAGLYEKVDLDQYPEFDFSGSDLAVSKLARQADAVGAITSQALRLKNATMRTASRIANKAGDLFSAVDDIAKIAAFKHYRAQGYQVADAAEKASKAVYSGTGRGRYKRGMAGMDLSATTYDRGARSRTIRALDVANFAFMSPFHAATQFVWEAGVKNFAGIRDGHWMLFTDPARAMRTYTLMGSGMALHELSKYTDGVSDEEESRQVPDTMRSLAPNRIKLPKAMQQLISPDGTMAWWNHETLTPWGQMTQGKYDTKRGRMTNLADNFVRTFVPGAGIANKMNGEGDNFPINPLLKPIVEQIFNQDMFSGRPIVNPNDTAWDQARPRIAHAVRAYLPPWISNPFGLLEAMQHVPARMDDGEQWGEFGRAAIQGLAKDSGHQFSKLLTGAANSIDYARFGESVRDSRRILDYQGRDQYMANAVIDFLGLRVEVRNALVNEVAQQRNRAKNAMAAEMLKNASQASRNMAPKERQDYMNKHRRAISEMKRAQPTLRWYETPRDSLENTLKAAQSLYERGVDVFGGGAAKPEDVT